MCGFVKKTITPCTDPSVLRLSILSPINAGRAEEFAEVDDQVHSIRFTRIRFGLCKGRSRFPGMFYVWGLSSQAYGVPLYCDRPILNYSWSMPKCQLVPNYPSDLARALLYGGSGRFSVMMQDNTRAFPAAKSGVRSGTERGSVGKRFGLFWNRRQDMPRHRLLRYPDGSTYG